MLLSYVGKDAEAYRKGLEAERISYCFLSSKKLDCCRSSIFADGAGNALSFFEHGALREKARLDLEALGKRLDLSQVESAIIAPCVADKSLIFYRFLKKKKVPYVFDPGAKLLNFKAEDFQKLSRDSFLTILSRRELELINKKLKRDLCKDTKLANLIVTLGAEGAAVFEKGKPKTRKDAVKQKRVVAMAGYEDALKGGLLAALAGGSALDEALEAGLRLAALQAGHKGTQNF
jgi:sugar/nucleoside kinase (ribokinase family)